MDLGRKISIAVVAVGLGGCGLARAEDFRDAKAIVERAVKAELAANRDDHTRWRYIDRQADAGKGTTVVVETDAGSISRHIEDGGKPVPAAVAKADDAKIESFIHDPAQQAKQRRDGAHDDKSAEELLNLLPTAFTWKVESETPESVTLHFQPDPNFHPPDMEARVMGEMSGTLVVDKAQYRIKTMKGALSEDVNIGFGILGRLRKGGTFDVERRPTGPGLWQITETHVHIDGKALVFKSIGQQQDEVKSDFTEVPAGTTLEQAVGLLGEKR